MARARSCVWRCYGTHYRDPLDWTEERLQQARKRSTDGILTSRGHFIGWLAIDATDGERLPPEDVI